MSIVDLWDRVNYGGHIDHGDEAQIPPAVAHLLEGLVGDVQALMEAAKQQQTTETAPMSRADALKLAREHVEAMSTNARGYQDGVKLSDKVSAMNAFARFLMGENE
ncbi:MULTISPECIES: hypothetical protein [unclassified Streptomyces]|uniref:hypothetical protein n=1 Tax=unclassified Streptomyces TaxID=2593676 RepID=UPI003D727C3A